MRALALAYLAGGASVVAVLMGLCWGAVRLMTRLSRPKWHPGCYTRLDYEKRKD